MCNLCIMCDKCGKVTRMKQLASKCPICGEQREPGEDACSNCGFAGPPPASPPGVSSKKNAADKKD